MKSFSIVVVALVLLVQLVNSLNLTVGDEKHFYWREYNDVVPKDAIPGGHPDHADVIYIGSAVANLYDESYGVYPGAIFNGVTTIDITVGGQVEKSGLSRMILCSETVNKFHWTRLSSWTFNTLFATTPTTRKPVRGGLQFEGSVYKYVYIGRYQHDYKYAIGKIPYIPNDTENPLYYADEDGKEHQTDNYEVLVLEL